MCFFQVCSSSSYKLPPIDVCVCVCDCLIVYVSLLLITHPACSIFMFFFCLFDSTRYVTLRSRYLSGPTCTSSKQLIPFFCLVIKVRLVGPNWRFDFNRIQINSIISTEIGFSKANKTRTCWDKKVIKSNNCWKKIVSISHILSYFYPVARRWCPPCFHHSSFLFSFLWLPRANKMYVFDSVCVCVTEWIQFIIECF